jgi:hypothetical protein
VEPATALARDLVAFDRQLAEAIVTYAKDQLARDQQAEKTTREWKDGFAHAERLRLLCNELERLLR